MSIYRLLSAMYSMSFIICLSIPSLAMALESPPTSTVSAADTQGAKTSKTINSPDQVISTLKKALNDLSNENKILKEERLISGTWETFYYRTYLPERANMQIAAFKWQMEASNYAMWFVFFLSTSGVMFAGYQLWVASKIALESGLADNMSVKSDFEVSKANLKTRSEAIGVTVLIVSFAFFYVFTREIYRIDMVQEASANNIHQHK